MSAIHMYMWVYECMVYDFCMYTMHDYIYIYISTHIYTVYVYIYIYLHIYIYIYINILIYHIYIYRKARSFQEYHCTDLPTCRSFASWLSSSSEAPAPGPKKNNNHLQRKKSGNFQGYPRKSRKSGRRKSSKASKQTWGSFGWEDSSS